METPPSPGAVPTSPAVPSDQPSPAALGPADPATIVELPALAAIDSAVAAPPPLEHPIQFHGTAREYFRIWIVNTLLTLLTCGIFIGWAKVRKRRYLRGSTELLGHRFDYRADPKRLLIGNLCVALFFLGYSLFGAVYPAVQVTVVLLAIPLLPWVVARSFTFNAHNTVYRGLRFRFHGSLSAAAWVYLAQPLVVIVSLGFYYPAWARARRAYAISNHRLGDAYFRFNATTGPYYVAYLLGALIVGASVLPIMVIAGIFSVANEGAPLAEHWALFGFLLPYALGLFTARHLIHARLFNHVWNHVQLDAHRFRARMQTGRWLGLQLTNLGAIIATAGLLLPWATIRSQRYTASCLTFEPAGPLENIETMGGRGGSATGDSAAEMIGLDFGL